MATAPKHLPFNLPHMTGKELHYISQAHANGSLAGDGPFTKRCHDWLEANAGCAKALLTHSCTAALEMIALLLDIQPGDEVIMPSYTFVSTANAFVLRGGVPVFVDIRNDTQNLDERLIEDAITDRTRAIVPVHYAGVACEMDAIMKIAEIHGLRVIEDAAQGMMASYKNRPLGSIGSMSAVSFHETKNLISGEGGAILINDEEFILGAEIVREKGTNRSQFFRGQVDKYTWQDVGSSFLPGELVAAFLSAQLEDARAITANRLASWNHYHDLMQPLEARGLLCRPVVPDGCAHNAHMYYVLLAPEVDRGAVLSAFARADINSVFHYVPLHSAPAGQRYGKIGSTMDVTNANSERLVRLPLFVGIDRGEQERAASILAAF